MQTSNGRRNPPYRPSTASAIMARSVVALLLVVVAIGGVLTGARAAGRSGRTRRILLVTHSGGFIHRSLVQAEKTLKELGGQNGFEVVCWRFTNDPDGKATYRKKVDGKEQEVEGTALDAYSVRFQAATGEPVTRDQIGRIDAGTLRGFDAVFFYTTGNPVETPGGLAALLEFVRRGKGFLGAHSATDTLYDMPEYGEMIGGYFDEHPWNRDTRIVVEDTRHPIMQGLGESFEIRDELYQHRAPYSRERLHILMRLDPEWVAARRAEEARQREEDQKTLAPRIAALEAEGKTEEARRLRRRLERKSAIHRTDNDFAMAWCREYGRGRVFYTALGHGEAVWQDARFQQMLVRAIRWATGDVAGDATPSGSGR